MISIKSASVYACAFLFVLGTAYAEEAAVETASDNQKNGFYCALDGRFEMPICVGNYGAITGVGGGCSLEGGYRLYSGWRFGLGYVFAENAAGADENATDISMMQNMVTVHVSKELNHSLIQQFPEWLIITPSLGAGADFISGSYVWRIDSETYTYGGAAFVLNTGLALEVETGTFAIPYFAVTTDLFFDISGLVAYPGINAGVRFEVNRILQGGR